MAPPWFRRMNVRRGRFGAFWPANQALIRTILLNVAHGNYFLFFIFYFFEYLRNPTRSLVKLLCYGGVGITPPKNGRTLQPRGCPGILRAALQKKKRHPRPQEHPSCHLLTTPHPSHSCSSLVVSFFFLRFHFSPHPPLTRQR